MTAVRSGVKREAYQHLIGSRARDLVPRWRQHQPTTAGRVMVCVAGFRESSGSVVVWTLIYVKSSSDRRRKYVGTA